jgi:hypothetical protein
LPFGTKLYQFLNFRLPSGSKDLMVDESRKLQKLIILKFSSKKKPREVTPSLLDKLGNGIVLCR